MEATKDIYEHMGETTARMANVERQLKETKEEVKFIGSSLHDILRGQDDIIDKLDRTIVPEQRKHSEHIKKNSQEISNVKKDVSDMEKRNWKRDVALTSAGGSLGASLGYVIAKGLDAIADVMQRM